MFSRAPIERPSFAKKETSSVALIKEPVQKFCERELLHRRDLPLDPALLLGAQDTYHAANVEAWPPVEKVST